MRAEDWNVGCILSLFPAQWPWSSQIDKILIVLVVIYALYDNSFQEMTIKLREIISYDMKNNGRRHSDKYCNNDRDPLSLC